MSLCCIGGVCIPYSVLWPIILLFLQRVWSFIYPSSKKAVDAEKSKECSVTNSSTSCCCAENSADLAAEQSELKEETGFLTDKANWERIVNSKKKTIVKFTATWCKPCKAVEPLFKELEDENRETLRFIRVDVDDFEDIAAKYGAISIPMFLCFENGKVVDKISGKDEEKIRAFVHANCL